MFVSRNNLRVLSLINKFHFCQGGNSGFNSRKHRFRDIRCLTSYDCLWKHYNKPSINRLNKSDMSTMVNEEENTSIFQFTNYDCIGFDLDNTLARYKVGAMIEMEYEVMAKFLVEKRGYNSEQLYKPFDHNFILRGLIVDDENGNLLRIDPNAVILQASHGTRLLTDDEIESYYPNRHWEPADVFNKDPLTTWNGPYAAKMRTLLDYFDIAAGLVFARAIDTIDKEKGEKQSKYYVWPDLVDALQDMFNREHFRTGNGNYFKEMKANPEKYYYKCSQQLLQWLKLLKSEGKSLFLITGSHRDFAAHTASNTLGPNWQEFFDIVICFAKKPGFFTMKRDFIGLENEREIGPVPLKDLCVGGIYTHGNWEDLNTFLRQVSKKESPKVLYVGDNLVQDIFTPNKYSHCETVTVCEELEAEGLHGHQQWHPDQHFLTSTVWGSYFFSKDKPTNWYYIMKKYSKLCVPSVEYIAALPIDHRFECNQPI